MTFADPLWLVALAGVAALALAAWRRTGGRPALPFSVAGEAAGLGATGWARWARLPDALALGALALGIVALARPQAVDTRVTREAEGIDIVLALDTSPSMAARDFRPNRFEVAKAVAAEFVRGRESDRIGLVVFAGEAYTQAPLTLDYGFLLAMLDGVQMGQIADGTAVGTALATAAARLRDSRAASRVVILLTDGENNAGEVDPVTAAEAAAALGVRVYAIGVGGEGGLLGGPFGAFAPGGVGAVDEEALTRVAELTGGRFFLASDAEALRAIYAEISRLERSSVASEVLTDRRDLYPWPLGAALALLASSALLSATRLRETP